MNQLQYLEQQQIKNASSILYGGLAQQNPQFLVSANRLLNAHNFDTIIECGSHTCGISLFFALYCHVSRYPATCDNPNEPSLFINRTHHRSPKSFHTFDYVVRDRAMIHTLKLLGANFYQADTLNDQAVINGIRSLIDNPASGTVLLLCDGGNKKKEVELYGEALKPGDFVMCHDWAYDSVAFERNKQQGIWFSHETKWENGEGEGQQFGIKDSCEKYGIKQIYADEFDQVAWFCGIKE